MVTVWIVKKVIYNFPSNRLKRLHGPIKRNCEMYFHLKNEPKPLFNPSNSNILRVSFAEEVEDVMIKLERICKIEIPKEEQINFLSYILPNIRRGDILRIRQISEEWDTDISKTFRE